MFTFQVKLCHSPINVGLQLTYMENVFESFKNAKPVLRFRNATCCIRNITTESWKEYVLKYNSGTIIYAAHFCISVLILKQASVKCGEGNQRCYKHFCPIMLPLSIHLSLQNLAIVNELISKLFMPKVRTYFLLTIFFNTWNAFIHKMYQNIHTDLNF